MILQRASYFSAGTLFPCLRSLVHVGLGVDLTSESSLPIRKSAAAPSRLQQLDAQRHSFITSITACSMEFEEGRLADLETNSDPVVQHRKMGAACLTMNRSASGNALNEEVLYISLQSKHRFAPCLRAFVVELQCWDSGPFMSCLTMASPGT